MKRVLLLLLVFTACMLSSEVWAQERTVTGNVTGVDSNQPIPGVNVVVKGTTIGTVTDVEGNYRISVPAGQNVLVFSFIGLTTKEVEVGNRSIIDVEMASDVRELSEIVVTAVGIERETKSLGYSATKVSNDEIVKARERSVLNALQGKVAGVNINSASGAPGSSTRVTVRGYSTINQSNQPLYVIDGVPMINDANTQDDLNGGYDFGNGVNDINPDDIESVTVLKGASATALYGSRGANGVVVITTKNGSNMAAQGKKFEVNFNSTYSREEILRLPHWQNQYGQGWEGDANLEENTSWGPRFDGEVRPWGRIRNNSQKLKPFVALEDNVKDFYDIGQLYNNSLSLGGGDEDVTYYASYSNINHDGIFPTDADSYDRHTIAVRGSANLSNNFKSSASINYVKTDSRFVYTGQENNSALNNIWQTPRDIPIKELEDYTDPFNDLEGYFTPYGLVNPYYALNEFGNENNNDRVFGNILLGYEFAEWISLNFRAGADFINQRVRLWEPKREIEGPNAGQSAPGSYEEQRIYRREFNTDLFLTISRNINEDIGLNVILGHNLNQRSNTRLFSEITDLTVPDFYHISNGTPQTPIEDQLLRRYMGVYANIDLSYRDFLFLTLTGRNDWSSTLPSGNNSYFYPSANVGFVFTDAFNLQNEILTFGKVRAGWAQTGLDADPYQVNSVFVQGFHEDGFRELNYPLSNGVNAFEVSNLIGNPNLQPEITTEIEVGADVGLFDNRIGIDFTWYKRNTTDLIFTVPLPSTTGYGSQTLNIGEIENKGIELLLKVNPIRTQDFRWDFSVNYSSNDNVLLETNEDLQRVSLGGLGGFPFIAKPGFYMGLFESTVALRDPEGNVVVDENGLPRTKAEPEVIGDAQVDFIVGLTNTFSYKGINLTATFDMRQGGVMYSRTADIMAFSGNTVNTLYNNRNPFIIPGSVYQPLSGEGQAADGNGRLIDDNGDPVYVENTTAISHNSNNFQTFISDGGVGLNQSFLIPKDFIKLRELSVMYDLPTTLLETLPFSRVSFGIVGRNLLLWTPEENVFADPEQTTFGNGIEADFGDFGAQPTTRSLGFNLNLTF